ncbi:UNVERIFIED_CONTAM: hypothetical protein FKN15_076932 [Acipenser sinensis]
MHAEPVCLCYLQDVASPFTVLERQEAVDWLLSLAVRFEYGDNADKYKNCQPHAAVDNTQTQSDPLIHLDINNPDFKAGVLALANLLQIQRHDDYLVMLKAIRILVQERLTQEAIAKAGRSKEGLPVALEKHLLGFDTGDATLNEAAAILRLLHIEELRDLQTRINEAIVAVQHGEYTNTFNFLITLFLLLSLPPVLHFRTPNHE